ncbi:hypothetical protein X975_17041, partial [Stegodyphus mimosarum]
WFSNYVVLCTFPSPSFPNPFIANTPSLNFYSVKSTRLD